MTSNSSTRCSESERRLSVFLVLYVLGGDGVELDDVTDSDEEDIDDELGDTGGVGVDEDLVLLGEPPKELVRLLTDNRPMILDEYMAWLPFLLIVNVSKHLAPTDVLTMYEALFV